MEMPKGFGVCASVHVRKLWILEVPEFDTSTSNEAYEIS